VIVIKLSARDKLKGTTVEVRTRATITHVKINAGGVIVTASITNEAAGELRLAAGQTA